MPRGDESEYTGKQKRQAERIVERYRESGVPQDEAERRAWATVSETTDGAGKIRSGRGREVGNVPARKGDTAAERRASARKAQTRARNAANKNARSKRVHYFYPYGVMK